MICEALVLANPFFTVPGLGGQPRKMSECPYDYEAYWKLGEYVIRVIENSSDEVSFALDSFKTSELVLTF